MKIDIHKPFVPVENQQGQPQPTNKLSEQITVGQYTIFSYRNGDFWISENESGEGMQIFKHNFEKLIDEFYRTEF